MNSSGGKLLVIVLASLVGIGASIFVNGGGLSKEARLKRSMEKAAREINKKTPMMIDAVTRLDSATIGPNNRFIYQYTVLGIDRASLDTEDFKRTMRPEIVKKFRNHTETHGMFEAGVTAVCTYKDERGMPIASIDVTPADIGF